jgi:DNA-binding HxlR family transcriptional regulator/CRP-like cAMP-binding protein
MNADDSKEVSRRKDLEISVQMLGDKWKFQILNALLELGPSRFSALQSYLRSISPTVLTEQLRALESASIVSRQPGVDGKVAKEYALTERGQRALPIIRALENWGQETRIERNAGTEIIDSAASAADNGFDSLKKVMTVNKIKKNEFLLREGSVCNFIGFVNRGVLRSFVTSDNAEFNNDFYLPDSIVCALTSFLSRNPTNCNIEALEDTEVCLISYDRFIGLVEKDIHWLRFSKTVSDSFFMRKCKRETSLLKHTSHERLQMARSIFPGIEQIVPQYHIASYLGIRAESLSRSKLLGYAKK